MRNRYPGTCYRCGGRVEADGGHFERRGNGWVVQHAECAIAYRGTKRTTGNCPASIAEAQVIYERRNGREMEHADG